MWTERVVPRLVDRALRGREIGELRAEVCAGLGGEVLELGFGGGLNLRHLPAAVSRVDAVEPSDRGWAISGRRRRRHDVEVRRVGLDGQRLAAGSQAYDHVLCTFTLCTIPDPLLALAEVHRVLRPGGTLAVLEHGLAPTPRTARWQRRLDPVQRRVAGGCHLSRDVAGLLEQTGFDTVALVEGYLPGARSPWTYGYRGRVGVAS
ncbi:class I SAM-dependent methyltransferase [Nocardioides dongxiaopingii]|uniref:class I SAM-dependent methyltransferase n=1 Tax=Nocardioides sp. S-1144 TaxID=2582905 RepID=UPI00110E3D77|nr:class I SAM-dependent methyltransferase [Nocardioides sp. S-1144]QCW50717.1 class I SAM-dependent methyltransferase [Nocardioides sp. S-1144]